MKTDTILRATLCALVLAALPGCELLDPDPTGPDEPNLASLEGALEGLMSSLEPVSFALDFLPEPIAAMEADGAEIGVMAARSFAAAPAGTGGPELAFDVVFPPNVQGATYVRNPSTHEFERDPDRADAPSDGVRVVHYHRLESGGFIIPMQEAGFIDLLDEDFGSTERLGIAVRDLEGVASADFLLGGQRDEFQSTREIEGTLTGDSQSVSLSMMSNENDFGGGFLQSSFYANLSAGTGVLDVSWGMEQDAESGDGEGYLQFVMDAGGASVFVDARLFATTGGTTELEGVIQAPGIDQEVVLGGTIHQPSFSTEGSLGTEEREILERIVAGVAEFVEAWRAPIGP